MLDLLPVSKIRLKHANIFTIGQLVQAKRTDLLKSSHIGHNTVNDIIGALKKYGWTL